MAIFHNRERNSNHYNNENSKNCQLCHLFNICFISLHKWTETYFKCEQSDTFKLIVKFKFGIVQCNSVIIFLLPRLLLNSSLISSTTVLCMFCSIVFCLQLITPKFLNTFQSSLHPSIFEPIKDKFFDRIHIIYPSFSSLFQITSCTNNNLVINSFSYAINHWYSF